MYSRWYRTPVVTHKFIPNSTPLCWRCESEPGTLLHIWWDCSYIQPFWKDVHDLISHITTFVPNFTAAQYLLHHSSLSQSAYKKSILLHLINVAKLCIPIHWKNRTPPSVSEWLRKIEHIADMENLICQTKDTPTKFYDKWACWLNFKVTAEFRRLSNASS